MNQRGTAIAESTPSIARALDGEGRALASVLADVGSGRLPLEELGARAGVLLAHRAARCEPALEAPRSLRRLQARAAARWVLIERALGTLGDTLAEAGVAWSPIKGADVATRVYGDPSLRPMSDIDVLVAEADYRAARRSLEASGWVNAAPGARFDRYVVEEGTGWSAERENSPLPIELHFRLWGFVPEGLGDRLLERSEADPSLGPTARRLRTADAFVLAAVHPWLHLPPRRLGSWWELHAFLAAGGEKLVYEAAAVANESGLHLPLALSADRLEALWNRRNAAALGVVLAPRLRPPERALVRWARTRHPDRVPIEALVLARLLAGRPSRSGLRPFVRRFWAHPGIVERLTPDDWSWPRRRAVHLLQCLKILPAPRSDWWRAPTHGHRAKRGGRRGSRPGPGEGAPSHPDR